MKKFSFILCCLILMINACSSTKIFDDGDKNHNLKMAELNIQLGMTYLGQRDMVRAKQKLLLAQDEAPQLPEVWYSLAYYYEITGDTSLAKQYYLKAISLSPHRGDTQNNYGTFLCHTGHYQEAIEHFNLAVMDINYLDAASAYENAGFCALKIPNKQLAKNYFKLAIEKDPNRSTSYNQLRQLE